jgi:hypothetical protein
VPAPGDAIFSFPGDARTASNNSFVDFADTLGPTCKTIGVIDSIVMATKSRRHS